MALQGLTPHPAPSPRCSASALRPSTAQLPWSLSTHQDPQHPPTAAGQRGHPGGRPRAPTLGTGGCPGGSWIGSFLAVAGLTPCWQHRAALVPHTGPFVGASTLVPTALGHPWVGVPGGGGSPKGRAPLPAPAHPCQDSAPACPPAPGLALNHVLCPTSRCHLGGSMPGWGVRVLRRFLGSSKGGGCDFPLFLSCFILKPGCDG